MFNSRTAGTAAVATRVLLLALVVVLGACGGDEQPQVDVRVTIDLPAAVPLGEPLDLGYTWEPADGFTAPAEDYQVFVHMVDPEGNIVMQDDHYPPQPTSQWTAGNAETYRHWLYPPEDLQVDYLDFVVGLYSVDGRAAIRADDGTWADGPIVRRLEIRADDLSGIPVYMDGWHPFEDVEDPEPRRWRWAMEESRLVFTNPMKDAVLHLRAHGPYDEVGPQTVVMRIGDAEVARLEIDTADEFMERIPIAAEAMGDGEWIEMTIEVSPVLKPQDLDPESQDDRSLGLQVFLVYLSSS